MQVDPKIAFAIGLVTTIALVLSNGALWTGALPDSAVHAVTSWANIIGTVGTAVLTFLSGISSSERGPITKALHP
jgi:hypothetical protein